MGVYLIKFLLLLCFLAASGCSINYVNSEGEEIVLGFVSFKTVGAGCATATSVKSIGVNYDSTERSGGFNLGYRSVMKVYVQDYGSIDFDVDENYQISVNSYMLPRERGGCQFQTGVSGDGKYQK